MSLTQTLPPPPKFAPVNTFANEDEFSKPHKRAKNEMFARGWGVWTKAFRGGIASPRETKLSNEQVLYRIGHSTSPLVKNLTSGWWMTAGTFLGLGVLAGRLEDYPARPGEDMSKRETVMQHMMRIKLAVSPDFGVFDTVFSIRLEQPLKAFSGRGFPAAEPGDDAERMAKSRPMAWFGAHEVAQLYIPGFWNFDDNVITSVATESIGFLGSVPVSAWNNIGLNTRGAVPYPWV
ncbi:hypothetical protein [Roseomonas sp. BN140053]|uniref:hypothetical protein n=1 Tax=Roseomonas sp. BN140053 TaxID=3391898 RepID=UPI0039EA0D66